VNEIVMYGADWCPDCRRAKSFLEENGIEYEYRDTELDEAAVEIVERLNNGKRVIPTFEILGQTYTNPDNAMLASALGINPAGRVIMYGADWCPDCRRAKSFLNDNHIRFQYIEVDKLEWATQVVESINNGKRTIPTFLINDKPYTNPDNPTLRDALRIDEEITTKTYDVVVIGAGAAGLTAAIYLQRAKLDTLVLEKVNVGGNAFLTSKIENYPGFTNISGPDLTQRMEDQAKTYGATIKEGVEVKRIERHDGFFRLETNMGEYEGSTVIVAVGSHYRTLEIPGEEDLIGVGVHFCAACDAPFYKGKKLLVIGGGNSALEEGIYLTEFAEHVTFVANEPTFAATQTFTDKLETIDNVTTLLNKTSEEFVANPDGSFQALRVRDNETGAEEEVEADGAFIFIGLTPNTSFLSDTLELDEQGFVDVAPGSVQTSVTGVFAAGDCRKGAIAQLAAATGEGVLASFAASEYLRHS
jgi:thioredoxin reductase (NADPH)